jgi:hypothetical protein
MLTKAVKSGEITEVYSDSYFNTKKSYKDIQSSLSRIDTTDAVENKECRSAGIS